MIIIGDLTLDDIQDMIKQLELKDLEDVGMVFYKNKKVYTYSKLEDTL